MVVPPACAELSPVRLVVLVLTGGFYPSRIQKSDWATAELLDGGTAPGQETRECEGRSYAAFHVLLRRHSSDGKLVDEW